MDINSLGTQEIRQLIADLEIELKRRLKSERSSFIQEVKAKADELNISLSEIVEEASKPAKKKTGITVKPKYRNPNNVTETWTGRGVKPRWVAAQLEGGRTLEEMRIPEEN